MTISNKSKIDLKVKKFCPHCNNNSIQEYLLHHFYDVKQGGLWDGEADTVQEPGASFIFLCKTCKQVLLYEFCFITPPDKKEIEGFIYYSEEDGIRYMEWDEREIKSHLSLFYPRIYEDIHHYVPASVKACYLKALKNARSPQMFAIEIRKAVESICEERGIDSKDDDGQYKKLGKKFEELCKIAMLPSYVKQIGHKMIKSGNDAAHSDIKPENVPLIRNFFRTLVNHVYVLPMQIQEWDSLNP